ncbi:hypothetical protein K2173_008692 [Erythroxylum novogranatense]|uniref:DUF4283 domain-containing protein n=1 Tax=Erythroxylum novogranatense TaxID=1862640 RepID=A0AAV8SL27_9ROSI|nr:hypothetical protein K2173_008692 [Erythroxylum novogranatense]
MEFPNPSKSDTMISLLNVDSKAVAGSVAAPTGAASTEEVDNLLRSSKKVKGAAEGVTGLERDADVEMEAREELACKGSYKDTLTGSSQVNLDPATDFLDVVSDEESDPEELDETDCPTIHLSPTDKQRIRRFWANTLIVKVLGRRIGYQFLVASLKRQWKLQCDVVLVDMGNDFYLAKFHSLDDYRLVLEDSPWMVADHLSSGVRRDARFHHARFHQWVNDCHLIDLGFSGQQNCIEALRDDNGQWIFEAEDLHDSSNLYIMRRFLTVHPDIWNAMSMEVTEAEITHALFHIGAHKAPGPDGFHTHFFQSQWGLVKPNVIRLVQRVFHDPSLLTGINDTFISLIPKCDFPEQWGLVKPNVVPSQCTLSSWGLVKPNVIRLVQRVFHDPSLLTGINDMFISLIPKCDFPEQVSQFRPIGLCNDPQKLCNQDFRAKYNIDQRFHHGMPTTSAASPL